MAVPKSVPSENTNPLTHEDFHALLSGGFAQVLGESKTIAVAVSGGPDSMALLHLLVHWAGQNDIALHALSVDHGLRPEAKNEVQAVADSIKDQDHVTHQILTWDGDKPDTAIQEEARNARYGLMAEYCAEHGIRHLFLAHHQNDQAETVLFRLAKGSGLDGLAGMSAVQSYDAHLLLVRPLLDVPKDRLLASCDAMNIPYAHDPSNESDDYARVRLRKAQAVLEEEGLTAKRLSVTAKRLARARHALEEVADMAFHDMAKVDTDRIVLKMDILRAWPGEIGLRMVLKVFSSLCPEKDYHPRMEKVERLFEDLMLSKNFPRQTLGGLIIARDDKTDEITFSKENAR